MNESLKPLGRLSSHERGFIVICNNCLTSDERAETSALPPIFYENIGPLYSQHCFRCYTQLVDGSSNVELFDGK